MTPSIVAEYRASKSTSISVLISLVVIYISPSCGDLTVGPSIDHSYSLAASMFSSVSTFGIAIMSCKVLDSRRRFFTLFRLNIQSWIFLSSSSVLDFLICFPSKLQTNVVRFKNSTVFPKIQICTHHLSIIKAPNPSCWYRRSCHRPFIPSSRQFFTILTINWFNYSRSTHNLVKRPILSAVYK